MFKKKVYLVTVQLKITWHVLGVSDGVMSWCFINIYLQYFNFNFYKKFRRLIKQPMIYYLFIPHGSHSETSVSLQCDLFFWGPLIVTIQLGLISIVLNMKMCLVTQNSIFLFGEWKIKPSKLTSHFLTYNYIWTSRTL